MPYQKLADRLAGLPWVVCGPMLRQVTPNSVTVFVALHKACTVTLTVTNTTPVAGVVPQPLTRTEHTRAIGTNLHVLAITAQQNGGIIAGATYVYDMNFQPDGGTAKTLLQPGVVAGTAVQAVAALTYDTIGAPDLPSFTAPPLDPEKLRIIHVSCRKPHGPGTDALPTVDSMIESSFSDTGADAAPRPHMLIHTGDQIYADDVADELLHVLIDASDALMGWTPGELLPLSTGPAAAPRTLRPGARTEVAREGELTSGKPPIGLLKWGHEPRSHLLGFGEFCAMYIHAWSPALWPTSMPTELQLYPVATPDELEAHLKQTAGQHDAVVNGFWPHLAKIRRLLANVPSLMQFDDHEVTDDWFLNLRWLMDSQNPATAAGKLGRSIIRNGMAAFAVFQSWGNTPDRYVQPAGGAPAAGAEILRLLEVWNADAGCPDTGATTTLKLLEDFLALPTGFTLDSATRLANCMQWHFTHAWPGVQIIVLDTRTMRVTPGSAGEPPALIGAAGLQQQVEAVARPSADDLVIVVSPAPVFGAAAHELLGKTKLHYADPEHWPLQESALQRLLATIVDRRAPGAAGTHRSRTVVLSGDVHYASTVRVQYRGRPFETPAAEPASYLVEAVIAQLTSSASKNQESKTQFIATMSKVAMPDKDIHGWTNAEGGMFAVFSSLNVAFLEKGSPVVFEDSGGPQPTPEWTAIVRPRADHRTPVMAGRVEAPTTPVVSATPAGRAATAKRSAATRAAELDNRRIVGVNNVGDIRFRWRPGDDKEVIHRLWFRLREADATAKPYTMHVVDLSVGQTDITTAQVLRLGDHDRDPGGVARYDGIDRTEPAPGTNLIGRRQSQLAALGFSLVGGVDGVFDEEMEEAVREFQIAARMPNSARSAGQVSGVIDDHEAVAVPTADRYTTAVTGRIDPRLGVVIDAWTANQWFNPVVVRAVQGAVVTAENIWRFDEHPVAADQVTVRDLAGAWSLPAGRAATAFHPAGSYRSAPANGPVAVAPTHVWAEAELLPAAANVASTAAMNAAQRSTFKVVRSISERECSGFLDSVATSDNAVIESGVFHWTFGLPDGADKRSGEFAAFAAFVRHAQPTAFDAVFTRFGLHPSRGWLQLDLSPTGRSMLTPQRTYVAWWARPDQPLVEISRSAAAANRFRSWHWFHRLQMAARTLSAWRRAMYDFARVRVRDVLSAPWGAAGVGSVADLAVGGATRPATIGDVITSERGVALLLRWHVFRPIDIVETMSASALLRQTLEAVGRPAGAPTTWPDSFEHQFLTILMATPPNGIGSLDDVVDWPRWQSANPFGFALELDGFLSTPSSVPPGYIPPTDISRANGLLSATRGSFLLDTAGLPPSPDYNQAGMP